MMSIFALEASALLGQISAGQLSADSSSTETLYCLNSVRPPKIPGWIVLVCEYFAVNKRAYRK